MARFRGTRATAGDPHRLGSLVCRGDAGNGVGSPSHEPRLRQLQRRGIVVPDPAPGDPVLAMRVRELLAPVPVALDEHWGFDHGAWTVLANAYPKADVRVVELSLDRTQPPAFHYELAARLAPLRDEGVLIAGSGNVIHNQEIGRNVWPAEPADWQQRFDTDLRARLERGDHAALIAYEKLGPDAQLAIPTSDHYLPFLSVLGLQRSDERPRILVEGRGEGINGLGMLSVAMG